MTQFSHQAVPFSEMPYRRPDPEVLRAAFRTAEDALRNAPDYAAARKAFFDLQAAREEFDTMSTLSYIRSTIDTTDTFYEEECRFIRSASAEMIPLRKAFSLALSESAWRGAFEEEFGAQLFRLVDAGLKTADERIIRDTVAGPSISPLLQDGLIKPLWPSSR